MPWEKRFVVLKLNYYKVVMLELNRISFLVNHLMKILNHTSQLYALN